MIQQKVNLLARVLKYPQIMSQVDKKWPHYVIIKKHVANSNKILSSFRYQNLGKSIINVISNQWIIEALDLSVLKIPINKK